MLKIIKDVAGVEAVGVVCSITKEDVQEECADGVGFIAASAEGDGGGARFLWPVAASDVGQDEKRFPDVGGAVVELVGDLGLGGGDRICMRCHEGFAFPKVSN